MIHLASIQVFMAYVYIRLNTCTIHICMRFSQSCASRLNNLACAEMCLCNCTEFASVGNMKIISVNMTSSVNGWCVCGVAWRCRICLII